MTSSDILQIVFSGVVAISTVVYSILTWRLVSETKRMREFQITPDVNIFFERAEADASFTYIVFKNVGLGYARNVKFEIVKDFKYYDNEHFQLKDKGLIKNGIDSFYSHQSFKFYFTDLSQNHKQKVLDNLIIKTTFYDINNKKFIKEFNLKLFELTGISIQYSPSFGQASCSCKREQVVKRIKSHQSFFSFYGQVHQAARVYKVKGVS